MMELTPTLRPAPSGRSPDPLSGADPSAPAGINFADLLHGLGAPQPGVVPPPPDAADPPDADAATEVDAAAGTDAARDAGRDGPPLPFAPAAGGPLIVPPDIAQTASPPPRTAEPVPAPVVAGTKVLASATAVATPATLAPTLAPTPELTPPPRSDDASPPGPTTIPPPTVAAVGPAPVAVRPEPGTASGRGESRPGGQASDVTDPVTAAPVAVAPIPALIPADPAGIAHVVPVPAMIQHAASDRSRGPARALAAPDAVEPEAPQPALPMPAADPVMVPGVATPVTASTVAPFLTTVTDGGTGDAANAAATTNPAAVTSVVPPPAPSGGAGGAVASNPGATPHFGAAAAATGEQAIAQRASFLADALTRGGTAALHLATPTLGALRVHLTPATADAMAGWTLSAAEVQAADRLAMTAPVAAEAIQRHLGTPVDLRVERSDPASFAGGAATQRDPADAGRGGSAWRPAHAEEPLARAVNRNDEATTSVRAGRAAPRDRLA